MLYPMVRPENGPILYVPTDAMDEIRAEAERLTGPIDEDVPITEFHQHGG